jgi:hypothetical protein
LPTANRKRTGRSRVLQKRIEKGEVKLPFDPEHGFLTALLSELKVDTNSQMLVFSKTSFQRDRISPTRPRALYFNDEVYIGYVHGSPLMEITSVDPKLGAVFYTVAQQRDSIPKFTRTDQCPRMSRLDEEPRRSRSSHPLVCVR